MDTKVRISSSMDGDKRTHIECRYGVKRQIFKEEVVEALQAYEDTVQPQEQPIVQECSPLECHHCEECDESEELDQTLVQT